MSDTAIQIEHLSKMYRLGVINNGVLFRDIQSWIALKRGKEDPHSKIGENKYRGDKDHFWALKDISFDIKQGDRLGIIGKNGAGKSTLLKILSRITIPTEGTVKIKGKIASLLEVGTGFHGELTGRENIYLNGAILGMKKRRIDEKLDSIIEFSGIEQHIDTPVKRYSSGMYVRLAFAVAAHLDSDILIADEVLAVGDAEFQNKALGKMQDLSTGEGRTVLFVSHNMTAVRNLCNYGAMIEKGKVIFNGDINDCIEKYSGFSILSTANEKRKSEQYYDVDNSKPFQIEKIEIIDKNGKQRAVYEAQEEMRIRMFCLSTIPISELCGYFLIKTINGQRIICSDSREGGKDLLNNLSKNDYIIDIIVPAGILSAGDYFITLHFGSDYFPGFYIQKLDDTLSFRIIDSISIQGNARNAMTSVITKWNFFNEEN
jgi:lipopolysaccharide transport system ATP-binding protein